jgi:predicted nucleotidyltransferase component of viral defense system
MSIIQQWLETFNIKTSEDLLNAKREIMQEVVLLGLARGGFFNEATFYGGTALRIHYGLNRYSEDLDFSLNRIDNNFTLEKYFKSIQDEFIALGLDVNIKLKEKKNISPVESAFLKENTYWGLLTVQPNLTKVSNLPQVKIKIEIDKTPPLLFDKEIKTLLRPATFQIYCMTIESLFAGKMHAVLYRAWKTREKGRDWYDLEWYIVKGVALNLKQLKDRAINSNHWQSNEELNQEKFLEIIKNRIEILNIDSVKNDIINFIPNASVLNIWSKQYFLDLAEKIRFV